MLLFSGENWFDSYGGTKPLLPGTRVIFQVPSEYGYQQKRVFREVEVTGEIFVRNQQGFVTVAGIDYNCGPYYDNPVVAYLQRLQPSSRTEDTPSPLSTSAPASSPQYP